MPNINLEYASLLHLLQLASPALPVGAYSYSEGIETLVSREIITDVDSLKLWLEQELNLGAIQLESAIVLRAYRATQNNDRPALIYWNSWLSAARETEELRNQSWQMGSALSRLIVKINPKTEFFVSAIGSPVNYAIAFGIAAASWHIDERSMLLGYLQSWATNLIGVGVKLIPLGQTSGQQLLLELQHPIVSATDNIITLEDDDLSSWGWGLSLASMAHETLYSRLFRS
ncbi:MAG: urease accessory protein UreF [Geitlerinemataceae cyanobacterium]